MIGKEIIDMIISAPLFTMECPDSPESGCIAKWSGSAADQLDALVMDRCRGVATYPIFRIRFRGSVDCCHEMNISFAATSPEEASRRAEEVSGYRSWPYGKPCGVPIRHPDLTALRSDWYGLVEPAF